MLLLSAYLWLNLLISNVWHVEIMMQNVIVGVLAVRFALEAYLKIQILGWSVQRIIHRFCHPTYNLDNRHVHYSRNSFIVQLNSIARKARMGSRSCNNSSSL